MRVKTGATYVTRKRSEVKQVWGEQEAAANTYPTRTCPHCGNQAEASEVQRDRITYKCGECNAKNTYTRPPDNVHEPEGRQKKLGSLTLKDSSKKKTEKTEKEEEKTDSTLSDDQTGIPVEERVKVQAIRTGMASAKVLSFEYVDGSGKKSFRTVEPYKITKDKSGSIILYGFCLEGNGIRTFKLPRIAKLQEQPYQFDPRWPVEDLL